MALDHQQKIALAYDADGIAVLDQLFRLAMLAALVVTGQQPDVLVAHDKNCRVACHAATDVAAGGCCEIGGFVACNTDLPRESDRFACQCPGWISTPFRTGFVSACPVQRPAATIRPLLQRD